MNAVVRLVTALLIIVCTHIFETIHCLQQTVLIYMYTYRHYMFLVDINCLHNYHPTHFFYSDTTATTQLVHISKIPQINHNLDFISVVNSISNVLYCIILHYIVLRCDIEQPICKLIEEK